MARGHRCATETGSQSCVRAEWEEADECRAGFLPPAERKEPPEPSHLIVDVKHSLLDLLVDLLGCVDERLRQTGSAC